MNQWTKWLAVGLVMFGAACGGEEEDELPEISSQTLTGTVNGESFTAVSGTAEDVFDDGEYWISIHGAEPKDGDPCGFQAYEIGAPEIIATVPAEAGDYEVGFLGDSVGVTFAFQSDDGESENYVATSGRLIIEEIADGVVRGGLIASTEDHEADGQFEVTICDGE